jgi:putative Ca2+/H+ antiporter (TMEM165/GDT1 family)
MEAFLVSTGAVALAEIGDKTQLLALVLAVRFRTPLPIIFGILGATLANHSLAAWLGVVAADWISAETLRWIVGISFIAMAGWALIPDKLDSEPKTNARLGAFATTLIAFFLVEIGDKTQIATVALAANFHSVFAVTAGTTLGMMLANVPVVYAGEMAGKRVPLKLMRRIAAALFFILGVAALVV